MGLHDTPFTTRVIGEHQEAEQVGFTGSPTFLFNGRDLFAEPDRATGLTCRMYRTPDGLAGVPTRAQLRQALEAVVNEIGRAPSAAPFDGNGGGGMTP